MMSVVQPGHLRITTFLPDESICCQCPQSGIKKHLKVKLTLLVAATVWIWFGCVP